MCLSGGVTLNILNTFPGVITPEQLTDGYTVMSVEIRGAGANVTAWSFEHEMRSGNGRLGSVCSRSHLISVACWHDTDPF